jgi:hypothetical protein
MDVTLKPGSALVTATFRDEKKGEFKFKFEPKEMRTKSILPIQNNVYNFLINSATNYWDAKLQNSINITLGYISDIKE